jgi:hypothetical protein
MLLQVVLEALLVILLFAWLWRSRKRPEAQNPAIPENLRNGVERFLAESGKIAETFQATLKDQKDLTSSLILKLDGRLANYRELLAATEEAIRDAETRLLKVGGDVITQAQAQYQAQYAAEQLKANPAAPEVRAMVLRLAKKGLSVEDIAVKARLHRGEVELIIDLEHQFGA